MSPLGVPASEMLQACADAVAAALDRLIPSASTPERRLFDAMRYATLNGGKRLRPFLALTTAAMFDVPRDSSLRAAAAIEMAHCYSLAHDDLPAMDNDDLRRGLPATHKKFDEATAILAGDALLTAAFATLADEATHADPSIRCLLISALAQALGPDGMLGGQMLDLLAERDASVRISFGEDALSRMHRMKTGRLISFSCTAGAVLGQAPTAAQQALADFGLDLGLTFQIVDDLLDVEGNPAETGKSRGKDAAAGKTTFASLLGPEQARIQAQALAKRAMSHLQAFDRTADPLRQIVDYVLDRRS